MTVHRLVQRLHPALSWTLDQLAETPSGPAFLDRATELSSSAAFADPVDRREALSPVCFVLERALPRGLSLTRAGYLAPGDVRAIAAVLPTMNDWPFRVTREVDADPVLGFRHELQRAGLLRTYRDTLRVTPAGRRGVADPDLLWSWIADRLVPAKGSDFERSASVVLLIHAATTDGVPDFRAVARTLTDAGWTHAGGAAVGVSEVTPVWNGLWDVLGNVGPSSGRRRDRKLSSAAIALARDALFVRVDEEDA